MRGGNGPRSRTTAWSRSRPRPPRWDAIPRAIRAAGPTSNRSTMSASARSGSSSPRDDAAPRPCERIGREEHVVFGRSSAEREANGAERLLGCDAHREDDRRRSLAAFVTRRSCRRGDLRRARENRVSGGLRKSHVERIRQSLIAVAVQGDPGHVRGEPIPQQVAQRARSIRDSRQVSRCDVAGDTQADDRRYFSVPGRSPRSWPAPSTNGASVVPCFT
jgi:hypothetical protein